jgi:hypothetical protein
LCGRPPLWKDAHEEKTAPGAAGSDGGVTGKLNASSSWLALTGVAGAASARLRGRARAADAGWPLGPAAAVT